MPRRPRLRLAIEKVNSLEGTLRKELYVRDMQRQLQEGLPTVPPEQYQRELDTEIAEAGNDAGQWLEQRAADLGVDLSPYRGLIESVNAELEQNRREIDEVFDKRHPLRKSVHANAARDARLAQAMEEALYSDTPAEDAARALDDFVARTNPEAYAEAYAENEEALQRGFFNTTEPSEEEREIQKLSEKSEAELDRMLTGQTESEDEQTGSGAGVVFEPNPTGSGESEK